MKNDGVFSYNKNIQRKFITAEMISLINFVLDTLSRDKRNTILNVILKTPNMDFNIDKKNGHIMLNEHNRTMLWNVIKPQFTNLNNMVIEQAAANVPAIAEVYNKRLEI